MSVRALLLALLATAGAAAGAPQERVVPITIRELPQDVDHDGRYECLDIDARLPIGRPHAHGCVVGSLLARGSTESIAILDIPGPVAERMSHQAIRFPEFTTDAAGVASVHLCFDGEGIGSRRRDGPWRVELHALLDSLEGLEPIAIRFTARTSPWSARRFGWERYRVRDVTQVIRADGEIRLHVTVDVLVAGLVELEAYSQWPFAEPLDDRPAESPPNRWFDRVEWSRRLPVGLHAVDLTLHLHGDGPGERAHGINGDSLYVNLSRTMVLGASTLAWTFRPGGGRHYGN